MNRFYDINASEGLGTLSDEESRHCTLILRNKVGDEIIVMNGRGGVFRCLLTNVSKGKCDYKVIESEISDPKDFKIHLMIAPTKNMDRMEWLIEKLSEIGVDKVSFIATHHSERRKLRNDRLEKKAISAMKQSGNPYLLKVRDLTFFSDVVDNELSESKVIAHVSKEHQHIGNIMQPKKDTAILIGPEGDFTPEEMKLALGKGFEPISLGTNTLRTETAGFVACCHVNFINRY